jgi:hypothetical protein
MPKIYMSGDKSYEVSIETALKAKQLWEEGEDKIDIGSQLIRGSRIISIDFGSKKSDKTYDFKNPEDKRIIKEFEEELEYAKQEELENPIEYYGEPRESGLVWNKIFGYVKPQIIQYAQRQGYVCKPDTWRVHPKFSEWCEKIKGLGDLKLAREYAEKKELESLDKSIGGLVEEKRI